MDRRFILKRVIIYQNHKSSIMKIGIVSDIHANEVALDAVLEDMENVDKLICCGDIIGYGPRPKNCVEKIREVSDVCVQGNHDRDVQNPERYMKGSGVHEGLKHAENNLTSEQFDWITGLDPKDTFNQYIVTHSHPENVDQYVYPRHFDELVGYLGDSKGLFLGHTHHQHAELFDDGLVLNPGSVGQPRDGDVRASYAVVNTQNQDYELRRIDYDISKVQEQIKIAGLPSKNARRLEEGK